MSRDIGKIGDAITGTLSDIHQITPHFTARDRSAEDLVSGELSLKSGNQRMVYLAGKFNFCLDPIIPSSFTSNEVDEGDIPDNNGNDRTYPENTQLMVELLAVLNDSRVKRLRHEKACCRL